MTQPFAHYRAWWNHLDMHSSLKMSMNLDMSPSLKNWYIRMWAKSLRSKSTLPADEYTIWAALQPERHSLKKSDARGKTRCDSSSLYLRGRSSMSICNHTCWNHVLLHSFLQRKNLSTILLNHRRCRQKRVQSLAAKTNANRERYCQVRWNKTHTHTPHTRTG